MSDPETKEIIELQAQLGDRLKHIGGLEASSRDSLARQLAHVAVLSRAFSDKVVPLFLSMDLRHQELLRKLIVSMKQDMDELRDAIQDLEPDFSELINSFGEDSR
jgi:hypothetical protein